jgi:hypothetical protein
LPLKPHPSIRFATQDAISIPVEWWVCFRCALLPRVKIWNS